MANIWEKPIITAKDITRILVQQYGPENPTRLLVEDDTKPMSYTSALVNCECLRCGAKFSYTPSSIVNALYYNGYVCNNCGTLSDSELQEQKKESMRKKTLETLKEHGIDVVQEAIDDAKEKKEADTDEDYQDTLKEAYEEANDMSKESVTPKVEEKKVEEIKQPKVKEEPKPEPVKAEKKSEVKKPAKHVEEEPKHEVEVNDYMVSDDDYNGSIGETATVVDEEDIPDDTGDDISEDDIFGVEEPVQTETTESVEPEIEEQPVEEKEVVEEKFGESEIDNKPIKENIQKIFEEKPEEEPSRDPSYIWIGSDAYTEDELSDALKEKMNSLIGKLKFIPFDPDTFEVNDDAKLLAVCKTCGKKISFDSLDDVDKVESYSDVCQRYGIDKTGKKNNFKNIEPVLYNCQECTNSIISNGYNEFHKKEVEEICEKAHLNIVDAGSHLFINDSNEELKVECNGVTKILKFSYILAKFGRGQDARLDPVFKKVEKKIEVKVNQEQKKEEPKAEPKVEVKETRSTENSDIKVVQETVNFAENVTEVKEEVKSIVREPEVKIIETKKEEPKVVLKPKATEEVPKRDPINNTSDRYTIHAKAPEPTEEQKAKIESFDSNTTQKKKIFSIRPDANNIHGGSMFDSQRATDSNAALENERLFNERQVDKTKVFSENPKLKTAAKNFAKLDGTENPFEREISLKQEFNETVFADFIREVAEKTGIDYKLVLDERSYEIPVVDFENGTRIICSNLDESGLANVRYEWLNRVPFSWYNEVAEDDGTGKLKRKPKKYKWDVLFSDSVEYAKDATFAALVKYINPSILAYNGKKIQLQDNLVIQYTKNQQYLRDFDKRNSTFPSKKPATGSVGIIARWNSTSKATARDVLKLRMQMEGRNQNVNNLDTLASDYSEYVVASIKYIEHLNPETNRVIYTITEYVEVGSSIVADGFAQCLRALLKEYVKKYPQFMTIPPYIVLEIDPNTFPSPSLQSYIDRGTLCKVDNSFKLITEGSKANLNAVDKSLKYVYVRRPEYRQGADLDRMRQDRRMFNAGTLIIRMANEIKQAGLSNTIRNPEVRKAFIENMGYIESTQAEIKQYFVNQMIVSEMMADGYTARLTERVDEDIFNSSKMVSNSNSGLGVNNVLMNPTAMMRYNNIMQNGSPEAKDYFMRMMREDYQQKMQDMMMQNQGTTGQVFSNNNQQQNPQQFNQFGFNPMMGNPMMNNGFGMGMNPMGFGMNPMGMGY